MNLVLLFPGQGSQKPGMGKDLAAAYPEARAVFDAVDRALGVPLSTLAFEGPEDELTATQNAQPALIAHSAAVWAVIRERVAPHVRAAAGHSAGELAAHHAAGTYELDDVVRLVRRRGELMAACGAQQPGAMAAIIGMPAAAVDALCHRAGAEGGVVVAANFNGPEQTVISGDVETVLRAMAMAKECGAKRALRINVAGAFHSPLMSCATADFETALQHAPGRDPRVPVYCNVTAEPVRTLADARRFLLEQLTAPVRWTDLVRRAASDYPDVLFVEVGPGAVLGNLVKRIIPGAHTVTCGTVADIGHLFERLG
jgi:[acyl-carrier-protein] S-malonyltransferase